MSKKSQCVRKKLQIPKHDLREPKKLKEKKKMKKNKTLQNYNTIMYEIKRKYTRK